MVDNFAILFNCTIRLNDGSNLSWGLMLCLCSDPLLVFFCFGIQLYVLLCPYLCFVSFLYIDLYVLGVDASISYGYFMLTKHLCVLFHIRFKGGVGTVKLV